MRLHSVPLDSPEWRSDPGDANGGGGMEEAEWAHGIPLGGIPWVRNVGQFAVVFLSLEPVNIDFR